MFTGTRRDSSPCCAPPSQRLIDLKARDVLQRASVAVMRACADSVITQFAKSPHAALTSKCQWRGLGQL